MTSLTTSPPRSVPYAPAALPVRRRSRASQRWLADRPGIRRFRFVRCVTDVLLVLAAVAVALAAVEVGSGRWAGRAVLSGSMRPTLDTGSVAVVERIPLSAARVGDILVLHRPAPSRILFVHRVIALDRTPEGIEVRTKGDHNPIADPGTLLVRGPYAYVVRWDLPYLGYASSWRYSPMGQRVLFGLGGLILVGAAVMIVAPNRDQDAQRRGRHLASS